MAELPKPIEKMKCIWNKNKIVPDTHLYNISINVQTSIDINSLVTYLEDVTRSTLTNIAMETHAKENLINIKYEETKN